MQRRNRRTGFRNGFSLLELVVTIAIIGILIALALPAISRVRNVARRAQCVNNLRNIGIAVAQFDQVHQRLPASGYYFELPGGAGSPHHSWAVSLLPYLDQGNVYNQWVLDLPLAHPDNQPLTKLRIPIYICPDDITQTGGGDQSYAVNGGWGYTIRNAAGVGDCPIDFHRRELDLNGDGQSCLDNGGILDEDRKLFKRLGLFFLEKWKPSDGIERHYRLDQIVDGMSQTLLLGENIRAGVAPTDTLSSYADPNPARSAFYVGNPCTAGHCSAGEVDYGRSNGGDDKINSGLLLAEGKSPVLNSLHTGGVNVAFADGHVSFLAENIDGPVLAALASPQGNHVLGLPIAQPIVSGSY